VSEVKPRKRYQSTLRSEQARQTRLRILDAGQVLFAERGYGAATVEAIASAAGVATDTVYATFGSKRGILHALMDVRVGGDDRDVAVIDREGAQSVRVETDPNRQLSVFARDIASIIERARPVDDIMRGAAAVDTEIGALRTGLQEERHVNMRAFVGWVAANGPLRNDMGEEDAAAIVWTLTSPEVHRLLRVERGWTAERYVAWLEETLKATLLPAEPAERSS
jgi:AcrR family transcriptional regulator